MTFISMDAMHRTRALIPVAVTGVAAIALAGCQSTEPAPESTAGAIEVVAVTDVYASIAEAVGGDRIEATAIVSGSAQDPHDYEATTRDQLVVSEADLLIVNGGGFDDFMTRLIEASETSAPVITAVDVSGLLEDDEAEGDEHDHEAEGDEHEHHHIEGFNEHVWYSFSAMEALVDAIADELTAIDPEGAADYRANAEAFDAELEALHEQTHELAEDLGGGDVIATEPVSAYLLADLGFTDVTPADFAEAIEEGTGVGVALLGEVTALIDAGTIRFVAVNTQSGGAEAEQIEQDAIAAGIPVVEFSETLPDGEDYVSWMTANVAAVQAALQ